MKYKRLFGENGTVWEFRFIASPVERCLYVLGDYDPSTDRNRPARLTFFFRDGRAVVDQTNIPSSAQHSISLSPNGKVFCISNWDRPLEAYATESGERLWRSTLRRCRDVLCTDTHWLTIRDDRELVQLDAASGNVTARIPTRMRRTALYDFSPHFCLVPLRGKHWGILHKDTLEIVQTIPNDILPTGILQDIRLCRDHIAILYENTQERKSFIRKVEYPLHRDILSDYDAAEETARAAFVREALQSNIRIRAEVGLRE